MAKSNKKSTLLKCLPDTNAFIGYFKGEPNSSNIIETAILNQTLVINAIVYAEFMVGANSKQQESMKLLVDHFGIEPITQEVVDKAIAIRKSVLRKKKRVLLLDCLIAASAILTNSELITADHDPSLL